MRPRAVEESFTLRRVARRLGWQPARLRPVPPERPVGAKLELTYACNLRCSFCYTDSPRRTLERATDLSDEAWLSVADQAADLGVIEAVLTGGEPFLRRELVFAMLERLESRGVGLTLNTNGWFVDEEAAERLAGVRGLHVHISVDGATPALHDASRGVPGSWRRAVDALHHLTTRGVSAHAVHVVTPDNAHAFPDFLEQMWTLGVPSVRVTPVLEVGAAARGGRWKVDRNRLRRRIEEFRRARGDDMKVRLQRGNAAAISIRDEVAPAALLVRPNGAVLIDSLHPFAFGHAIDDGLDRCWRAIVERWRDPRISAWASSLGGSRDLPDADVVPYLDNEVPVAQPASTPGPDGKRHQDDRVPAPLPPKEPGGHEGLERARAHVRDLALRRRYRLTDVRWSGGSGERYVRRVRDGRVCRLNESAAVAMDALAGGTVADATARLAKRFPETERNRLERDALALSRSLVRRGVIAAAESRADAVPVDAGTPDLPDLPLGES